MRVDNEIKLDFKDVLIRPKRSTLTSRSDVDLHRKLTFKHSQQEFTGIPIIAANMDGVGTLDMMASMWPHGLQVALRKQYTSEEIKMSWLENPRRLLDNWLSFGITDADLQKLSQLSTTLPLTNICIDVANGYTEKFLDTIKRLRDLYPGTTIMAGNVVTGDMVEALILAGADVVKIGIGGGSVCSTRKITGVGYPQLSAVIECADAAHGLKGLICSDGGCQVPGDVAKSLGAGADFVMLGGMLAGHDQGEYPETFERDGGKFVSFYGMSSDTAQMRHEGQMRDYRASEGKTVEIEAKGDVQNTITEILGGLRSACTYVGAPSLKELSKRTTFVRVTQQLNPMFS
jgi:GMP reductase